MRRRWAVRETGSDWVVMERENYTNIAEVLNKDQAEVICAALNVAEEVHDLHLSAVIKLMSGVAGLHPETRKVANFARERPPTPASERMETSLRDVLKLLEMASSAQKRGDLWNEVRQRVLIGLG